MQETLLATVLVTALATAFKTACMAELEALKPGNVHVFADGHGMTVQDFIASAEAVASVITQANLSLGERILHSVQATQQAVATNTNLGIILLCAPIIQAKLNQHSMALQPQGLSPQNIPAEAGYSCVKPQGLSPQNISAEADYTYVKPNIHAVLGASTIKDADACFAAIRLANPAGLGASDTFDVNQKANCTLLQAMQQAANRDLIAQQYANHFADVLAGLAHYQQLLQQWQRPAWAASAVHLWFMRQFLDSHIVRKYGETIAKMVQAEASEHEQALLACYNPKNYMMPLLNFDAALKKRGLNPGTSADLTVAVLFLHQIGVAA